MDENNKVEIYSKSRPEKLLHLVYRFEALTSRENQREELVTPNNFIQCASLKMKKGTTFKPHQHIWKRREGSVIAQESWVVLLGSVRCFFYDLNGELLSTVDLKKGDISITLEGGHTYLILEDDTLVYEYKTGPYEGQVLDKVFLD